MELYIWQLDLRKGVVCVGVRNKFPNATNGCKNGWVTILQKVMKFHGVREQIEIIILNKMTIFHGYIFFSLGVLHFIVFVIFFRRNILLFNAYENLYWKRMILKKKVENKSWNNAKIRNKKQKNKTKNSQKRGF